MNKGLVKMKYDSEKRAYIIEISEKVLTSRITEDYFVARFVQGVPYAMLADELIRRTRKLNER